MRAVVTDILYHANHTRRQFPAPGCATRASVDRRPAGTRPADDASRRTIRRAGHSGGRGDSRHNRRRFVRVLDDAVWNAENFGGWPGDRVSGFAPMDDCHSAGLGVTAREELALWRGSGDSRFRRAGGMCSLSLRACTGEVAPLAAVAGVFRPRIRAERMVFPSRRPIRERMSLRGLTDDICCHAAPYEPKSNPLSSDGAPTMRRLNFVVPSNLATQASAPPSFRSSTSTGPSTV
jgi:hypothetical protein